MIGRGEAARILEAAEARRLGDPLRSVRLTDPQQAFLQDGRRKLLWRGGNSIGKTFAHVLHILHFARGTHPWQATPRGPKQLMLAGYSFAQMDPLCRALWAIIPKDEIDPKVTYAPRQGFRGYKEPVIPFIRGPGAGSVIAFATYKQGAGRIMGDQLHYFGMDEPPPEGVWGEAQPRLNRHSGQARVTMTPTPDSPPLGYMRKLVEDGKLTEMQTSLTVEAVTRRGGLIDSPWMSADDIEVALSSYLDDELPMRRDGAWDALVSGRWLSAVTDAILIDEIPDSGWYVAVGVDHGAKAGRQYASLVLASADGEQVIVADEAHADGVTTTREDAQALLAMLQRNGIPYHQVDHWRGDRRHAGDFWGNEKTNRELAREICDELGIRQRDAVERGLRIRTPRKYQGSVRFGFRLINSLAKAGRLQVHRRCDGFRTGALGWVGRPEDPLKDPLDAARYAIEALHDAQVIHARRVEAA
jgi:phage terminase large subunit-like protein